MKRQGCTWPLLTTFCMAMGYALTTGFNKCIHMYIPFKIYNMLAHQYVLTRSRVLDKYIYEFDASRWPLHSVDNATIEVAGNG
jgi:hypothetical protein